MGSLPTLASRSCTAGTCMAFCDSAWSLSTMSRGVFAGTKIPVQNR
jgi:hypothetical protein